MFTIKPPLQFLGASSGNMRKHAYSWKYNSVIWQNTSKLNATGILADLRKSQMANNYQVANDYMVSPNVKCELSQCARH
jgi:hypothetical protein